MTQDDKFRLAVAGDSLRMLNTTDPTPNDMWQLLKDIERADLKLEAQTATRRRV